MTSTWLIVALFISLAVVVAVLFYVLRSSSMALASMQQQTSMLSLQLQEKLQSSFQQTVTLMNHMQGLVQNAQHTVGERLDKNHELFGKVQERLGKIEQASLDIKSIGKDLSELQNLFKSPKLRGNLGELGLEQILNQILPSPHYQMQYAFPNKVIADAIIRLADKHLVSIDAKFPYENFKRMMVDGITDEERQAHRKEFQKDLKKHIDDISHKYIQPEAGTLDFALMYIPAEHVYYEAVLKDDRFGEHTSIHAYALKKRVIPVSPNSIYAYLQAIALGLRGLRIEDKAKEIFVTLEKFKLDLNRLSDDMGRMGKHLVNAHTAFEDCEKRMDRVKNRIEGIQNDAAPLITEKVETA